MHSSEVWRLLYGEYKHYTIIRTTAQAFQSREYCDHFEPGTESVNEIVCCNLDIILYIDQCLNTLMTIQFPGPWCTEKDIDTCDIETQILAFVFLYV